MRRQKRVRSLKTKFFLSMSFLTSSVILLLLVTVSLVFYYYFMSMQAESSVKQLNAINNQLSFYLSSMDNYSKMMISDTNIQRNVKNYESPGASYTEADRTGLRSEMRKFLQTIPYIHSATIYGDDGSCITSTAVTVCPTDLKALAVQDNITFALTKKYSNFDLRSEVQALSFIRPFYEISTGKKLGYVEISITEEDIRSLYARDTSDTSRFFITDEKGMIVSTDGARSLGETFFPLQQYGEAIPEQFHSGNGYICFVSHMEQLDWYIVNEVRLLAFYRPLYLILLATLIISLLFLGIFMVISRRISETITKPLYLLINHIQKVKEGNWGPLNNVPEDADLKLLFREFDSMILAQEKLTNDLVISQRQKDRLSLDLLQQQVNPHFLYNTLDNIGSLAALDEKNTLISLVRSLSDFYRLSLSDGNLVISVGEELELTQAYVNIMQIRYVNKFSFSAFCPEDLKDCSCLKLLLQPVIENSIYHGIKEMDEFGYITLEVRERESHLIFTIRDNGPGMAADTLKQIAESDESHFGIRSVQKRICMHYGNSCGIAMQNMESGGLETIISIPKQKWSDTDGADKI